MLIVEDDWLQRMALVHELRRARCDVAEAATGQEALSYLQNGHRIDLVITDVNLSGSLNGWDVAESARAAYPKIPIIYVSGNSVDPKRQVSDSVFLAKPCGSADVLKALPPI
jgi:CheY-like chemotaxis protein